jgi:hypothetical protein
MQENSRYTYQSLSTDSESAEIRVIELLPKVLFPNQIRCNIRHVRLCDEPIYEALSYCWGPQEPSFSIFCDGCQFDVGANLQHALQRLRLDEQSRVLWVDAICINQQDDVEKSQQVQKMRTIYKKSRRTVVWLGDGDEMDVIIPLMEKLLRSSDLMTANGDNRRMEQMSLGDIARYEIPISDMKAKIPFRALLTLLNRPWFQRVWIIQEAAVPTEVELLCGSHSIPWDQFVKVMLFIGSFGLEYIFTNLGGSRSTWSLVVAVRAMIQGGEDIPLLDLLWLSKESLATDPRDRIFALCGLSSDAAQPELNIEINYSQTQTPQLVFQQTAVAMIRRSRNLDILTIPRRSDNLNPLGLPSWVPDWSSNHKVYALREKGLRMPSDPLPKNDFLASSSTDYELLLTADGRQLVVSGLYIDWMEKLGPTCDFGEVKDAIEKAKKDGERTLAWMDITDAESNELYKTGESHLDAYWQTFYGGYYGISYEEAKTLFFEYYGWLTRNHLWLRLGLSRWMGLYKAVTFVDFAVQYLSKGVRNLHRHNMLMAIQKSRRMGISKTGYMCLAPSIAEPGDCIFVLRGGAVPFLLRPSESGSYELIGEIYVHGIMKGEAWSEADCESIHIA